MALTDDEYDYVKHRPLLLAGTKMSSRLICLLKLIFKRRWKNDGRSLMLVGAD